MGRETVSVFAILCFESAPRWSAKSEAEVTMGLEAMRIDFGSDPFRGISNRYSSECVFFSSTRRRKFGREA